MFNRLLTFIVSIFFCTGIMAQGDAHLQQNMQLSCYNVSHYSASGEELSYKDYFDRFNFDGQGTYTFGTLGKLGRQQGSYSVDGQGQVKFTGPFAAMKFSYQFKGKEENAYDKMENKYALTFTEANGTRHVCNCIVLKRETAAAALPVPAPGGQKLNGVYYYYTPDMYDPVTGIKQVFSKYYYFMPNGYLHIGLPTGGLENCNCTVAPYKKNCHTYSISGNTITISGEGAKTFARKDHSLVIGKQTFWPVPLVRESSLPGKYKLMWSATGAVHQTFWTFNADHSFTQTAVGAASPGAVFGIPIKGAVEELKGTWNIKGSMLELKYSTGEVKTHTLVHTYGQKDEVTIDGASCYKM
jgi:hypothetical protein